MSSSSRWCQRKAVAAGAVPGNSTRDQTNGRQSRRDRGGLEGGQNSALDTIAPPGDGCSVATGGSPVAAGMRQVSRLSLRKQVSSGREDDARDWKTGQWALAPLAPWGRKAGFVL